MMGRWKKRALPSPEYWVLAGLCLTVLLGAGPSDPPVAVEQAVREAVAEVWEVEPDQVHLEWRSPGDSLSSDPRQVRLLGSGRGGHWVVEVEGSGSLGRRSIRAGTTEVQWVASRTLSRGHVLEEEDLRSETAFRWGGPRVGASQPPLGWEVQTVVRVGQKVGPPAIAPPLLIQAGSSVDARLRSGAVTLRITGQARESGRLNDQVHVRLPTGKTLVGTVVPGPMVELDR
jgi:flagella basal body P-ring formation protein FlgA